ncbi:MAG TPA: LLM class F420-dependent oxidoreductase [Ktedonobacteraceae bacterium]|nr:LLM class F420-dependent oxidoreductase [Ktedonobacteraceae bacterium]
MRLGLQIPNYTFPGGQDQLGDTFGLIVERAERAGFYSLWVMDHFFQLRPLGGPERDMLEGWSALAYAAGRTHRIKLGTLVTGVTYRHPGILVKMASTLDVLSHGRAYFGIGSAWSEEEHHGLGIPFPPQAERFERLEETLQIALQMWSGNDQPYVGKHYQLGRPLNMPQAVQKPHPPILIGGAGEKKTLRLVAQYGDACNFDPQRISREELQHKFVVLRQHCEAVGRPYEQIEKTTIESMLYLTHDGRDGSLTPQALVAHLKELADLGVDHALISLRNVQDSEPFDLLATEVIPQVEQLAVAGR